MSAAVYTYASHIPEYEDEIIRAHQASFYTDMIQDPILYAVGAVSLSLVLRSIRLKSNIFHTILAFNIAFLIGFIFNMILGSRGMHNTGVRGYDNYSKGLYYAEAFRLLFLNGALVGTQLVAAQLVYPDSKPSEKLIYRAITGFQFLAVLAQWGMNLQLGIWVTKTYKSMVNGNGRYLDDIDYTAYYNVTDAVRYFNIGLYAIGLFFTTLLMWGSLNFRRIKATFPQATQKRIIGYAICFPMFLAYLSKVVQVAITEILGRTYFHGKTFFVHLPNAITAFRWIFFFSIISYLVGWIFLVAEWKKGNRAAAGNVSMADFDLKPQFLVGGQGAKDETELRQSVSA